MMIETIIIPQNVYQYFCLGMNQAEARFPGRVEMLDSRPHENMSLLAIDLKFTSPSDLFYLGMVIEQLKAVDVERRKALEFQQELVKHLTPSNN